MSAINETVGNIEFVTQKIGNVEPIAATHFVDLIEVKKSATNKNMQSRKMAASLKFVQSV